MHLKITFMRGRAQHQATGLRGVLDSFPKAIDRLAGMIDRFNTRRPGLPFPP
jgi:hypothetical protein